MPAFSGDTVVKNVDKAKAAPLADAAAEPKLPVSPTPIADQTPLPVSREGLQAAQEADPMLRNKASGDQIHYVS